MCLFGIFDRQLAARFGTCLSAVHESVDMVLNAITSAITDTVKFPSTHEECLRLSKVFERRNGFPGIVGAIDGTHIPISKPCSEPDIWIDRKGTYSIAVAAVVDARKQFVYYSVGCPGSFHDQRVYRLGDIDELVQALPDNFHLIGDSAYTLSSHMIIPYKDNGRLTVTQRDFNYKLSCNRMVVEHAFGLLKNKFPRIHYPLQVLSWKRAVHIITACMLLHNFILRTETDDTLDVLPTATTTELPVEKEARRDRICALLQNQ